MRINLIRSIISTYQGIIRRAHNGFPITVRESIWCLRAKRVICRSKGLDPGLF